MNNSFKCRSCKTEISLTRQAHRCEGYFTVYIPNVSKASKQDKPEYRKRFGSRKAK